MTAGFQVSLVVFGLLVIVMFLFTRFWQTEYENALKERNKWRDKYYRAEEKGRNEHYRYMQILNMYQETMRENEKLKFKLADRQIENIFKTPDKDLLDAVKKGMVAAHPDKGGNANDFIRFRKVYNELKERAH